MAIPRTQTRNTGWVRLPQTYSTFIGKLGYYHYTTPAQDDRPTFYAQKAAGSMFLCGVGRVAYAVTESSVAIPLFS